ncbi:hypothetical protein DM992_12515 [Burkholderia sp. JP2-270]|nr:hypothetical protein DM992_12515 [Burkholderia sp. JP2-270]
MTSIDALLLLKDIESMRRTGIAFDRQEHEEGAAALWRCSTAASTTVSQCRLLCRRFGSNAICPP